MLPAVTTNANREPAESAGHPGSTRAFGASVEYRIVRTVVASAVVPLMAISRSDPDLWGHLKFGDDILRSGIPQFDTYSFTSDVPWINHEWLAEVVFWLAWSTAGSIGLIASRLATVLAMALIARRVLRSAGLSVLAVDLLTVVLLFGTWPRTVDVRPQLFSVLLTTALLWVINASERGHRRTFFVLPLIFAAWINLHGGWVVGAGILALYVSLEVLRGRPPLPFGLLILVAIASIAALFANPYGQNMLLFIGETVRFERADIADWLPLWHNRLLLVPWLGSACVAVFLMVRCRRTLPLSHAGVVIAFAVASLRVSRLDAFFAIAVVMLLGPLWGTSSPERPPASVGWRPEALIVLIISAVGSAALTLGAGLPIGCLRSDQPWMAERQAGAFLRANRLSGRMLTWYSWGEYAIWHLAPDVKVSLDGRRETVYSEQVLADHYALYDTPDAHLAVLERLDADYAWLPAQMPLVTALDRLGWTRIFSGPSSTIFARRPGEYRAAPELAGTPCFPGP